MNDERDAARYRFVRDELMHDELDQLAALSSSEWDAHVDAIMEARKSMNEPKKFTRAAPVSKTDLHNCFWSVPNGHFAGVPLVEARTVIGKNAELYLQKKGYARIEERVSLKHAAGEDWIMLTVEGQKWLTEGLQSLLAKHPERRSEVNMLNRK